MSLTLLAGWVAGAGAQTPWNRELQTIAVLPETGGGYSIQTVWSVDVEETSAPLDLSTDVVLHIGGTPVATLSFSVGIDAGSGADCGSGPSCSGSCGSGTLDGGAIALLCYEDGPCSETFCDCDCGYWIVADFGSQPLMPGDEIMVILMPGPGSLPDPDTSDDAVLTTFHDRAIGWSRSIDATALIETGPGIYDVQVVGSVGSESPTSYLNLDFEVELSVNGTVLSSVNVPAAVEHIYDQPCWVAGCGSACGNMNGIPRYCDPFLWWACGCVGGWITIFPGVSLQPEDEIMVLLRPAPGALPELPGMNEDDQYITSCCEPAAVGDSGDRVRPWQLGQNRPNPFGHLSSIPFSLAVGGAARVEVFASDGRHIKTLLDRNLSAGQWSITWDGRNAAGEAVPTGAYFYELTLDGRSETRKMTLLK